MFSLRLQPNEFVVIFVSEKEPVDSNYSAMFESEFPRDLRLMIVLLATGIAAIYLPFLNATLLRYVLPLPVLLFIPGYCLIAAVFPNEDDIDLLARIVLSIGLSIAVVILLGLGLNFTPRGIQLDPVVLVVTTFTLVMILVANYRRALLPIEKRFTIPIFKIAADIRETALPSGENTVDHLLSIALTAVIIIAIITTAFVIFFPNNGERFSEFYVLSENHTSSDYPVQIVPGADYPLYIGIGNHEQRNVTYTIETWILQTEFNPVTNTSHILTMDPVEEMTANLGHNESRIIPYNLSVRKSGYDRVEFLLFNETVPGAGVTGSDRINESYRDLHLWIKVK
jgi:uncharacterized membrane protein